MNRKSQTAQKFIILFIILSCLIIFLTSADMEGNQMDNDEIEGVVYFSTGASLIKYNFASASKKKEMIFRYMEESELGREITHITYPVYLKTKNKMLFIGSKLSEDHIFESDLNVKNWKEYKNMKNVRVLSLSPDESMLAYHRHPNKLVIKRYEDLEKDNQEKIVANNSFVTKPLWLSRFELVYNSIDNEVIRVNIQSSEQQILVKGVYANSISPDKRYILCSYKDSIYLYDLNVSQSKLIKKAKDLCYSHGDIWSPDGKYFLFSKLRKVKFTLNIFKYMNDIIAERMDLYVYSIATGEEYKIIEDIVLSGGFWLEE